MKNILSTVSLVALCIAISGCSNKGGGQVEKMYKGPEARNWLAKNNNESALASNHFGATASAKAFVEKLYKAGAKEVRISQESIRDDEETIKLEGGPYADAIVVVLPTETKIKKALLKICEQESDPDYGKPEVKNNMIFLWWD